MIFLWTVNRKDEASASSAIGSISDDIQRIKHQRMNSLMREKECMCMCVRRFEMRGCDCCVTFSCVSILHSEM